jgi:hypothetical protein
MEPNLFQVGYTSLIPLSQLNLLQIRIYIKEYVSKNCFVTLPEVRKFEAYYTQIRKKPEKFSYILKPSNRVG